jgi:hypothetical protein
MRYLKRFNEAVIKPHDFKDELDKVRSMKEVTLEDLKQIFYPVDVEFVNVDYFISKLQTKREIESVPVKMPPMLGGIRWGAHNVYTNKMYICIEEGTFLESINGPQKTKMLDFLEEILRHESVHKQQAEKRPGVTIRNLERSPMDPKKYFGSTDEIMAYADSFIVECRKRGMSDDDIINALRGGQKVSWIQNVYASMDKPTQNRFKKYVYEYIAKK